LTPARYAVVIEKGERNYSAYLQDLPGCVSVGDTLEEARAEIRAAIEFRLEGMRQDGLPIPKPLELCGICRNGQKQARCPSE
jgi:predicted RNase H-like HicB family nuclease